MRMGLGVGGIIFWVANAVSPIRIKSYRNETELGVTVSTSNSQNVIEVDANSDAINKRLTWRANFAGTPVFNKMHNMGFHLKCVETLTYVTDNFYLMDSPSQRCIIMKRTTNDDLESSDEKDYFQWFTIPVHSETNTFLIKNVGSQRCLASTRKGERVETIREDIGDKSQWWTVMDFGDRIAGINRSMKSFANTAFVAFGVFCVFCVFYVTILHGVSVLFGCLILWRLFNIWPFKKHVNPKNT